MFALLTRCEHATQPNYLKMDAVIISLQQHEHAESVCPLTMFALMSRCEYATVPQKLPVDNEEKDSSTAKEILYRLSRSMFERS